MGGGAPAIRIIANGTKLDKTGQNPGRFHMLMAE